MQLNVDLWNHSILTLDVYPFCQASLVNGLIADEYLKNASTREDIRDAFTEIMGDLLMTLPVMKVVGHLTGPEYKDVNVTLTCIHCRPHCLGALLYGPAKVLYYGHM